MSITLLSVALCATCAIGAQKITDTDVSNAITMIASELESRHNEERCWDPINPAQGWLHRHTGTTTAITSLALLSKGQSAHSPTLQLHVHRLFQNQRSAVGPYETMLHYQLFTPLLSERGK